MCLDKAASHKEREGAATVSRGGVAHIVGRANINYIYANKF